MRGKEQDCEQCFKIKCKNCGWEPDSGEMELLNQGLLTKCPDCGGGK